MKNRDCFCLNLIKIIIGLLFLSACSRNFLSASSSSSKSGTTETQKENLGYCSDLSFDKVSWDPRLNISAQRNFAIALNITGSFEGNDGWQNLTNDFDGQGMSAGLLNQTLRTGSLEPLLASYENQFPSEFAGFFSNEHFSSITSMLDAWKRATQWKPSAINLNSVSIDLDQYFDPTGYNLYDIYDLNIHTESSSPNSTAAQWARTNLYQSNDRFIPQWKTELQNMLKAPNYVSLQIGAALNIHQRAMLYVKRVGISDLRTYLLMFDFVTQNGDIQETRFQQWEQQVASQRITDVAQKLKLLVEIRLQDTLPQWRDDVRSRKNTIIDGSGFVHGENRNLTKSYCYKSTDAI